MQILKLLKKAGFGVRDLLEGVWTEEQQGKCDDGNGKRRESGRRAEEEGASRVSKLAGGNDGQTGSSLGQERITREDGMRWRREGVYLWEVWRR